MFMADRLRTTAVHPSHLYSVSHLSVDPSGGIFPRLKLDRPISPQESLGAMPTMTGSFAMPMAETLSVVQKARENRAKTSPHGSKPDILSS